MWQCGTCHLEKSLIIHEILLQEAKSCIVMVRSHQAKAKCERDISSMETNRLGKTIHTKRKRKRFLLNGLQSHSSESQSDTRSLSLRVNEALVFNESPALR